MIKLDATELVQELRVLREELRIIKTLISDRLPPGTVVSPPDRVLTRKQVVAMVPLAWERITQLRRAGQFPEAVRMKNARIGFMESEIREWMKVRRLAELTNGSVKL